MTSDAANDGFGEDDTPVTVCIAHYRFVPCRRGGVHRFSTDPEDVAAVAAYQRGD